MKKVISVLLALVMLFGVASVGTVSVFAEEAQETADESAPAVDNATGAVSGYKEFNYECDYCGETHSGFFGVLITMIHTVLSAVKLAVAAVKR